MVNRMRGKNAAHLLPRPVGGADHLLHMELVSIKSACRRFTEETMPFLKIETNKKLTEEEVVHVMDKLADLIVNQFRGLPKNFVFVTISHDSHMFFRNSTEPAAFCTFKVKNLKRFKKENDLENLDLTISAHVRVLLDLPDGRVFAEVLDMDRKGVSSYFDGLF